MTLTEHQNIARAALVAEAASYVTSRFYPPLPVAYGDLAVTALETYAEFGPDGAVELPSDLNPMPRAAWLEDGVPFVSAGDLVDALRIGHMLAGD